MSSNSELDQAGPRPIVVYGPRGGGQVAAVDGGAAGGVRDDRPVAEQLGDQFDVGGFAAAGAGAGELKQRPQQLRVLDRGRVDQLAVHVGDLHEEVPVLVLALAQGRLGSHVQGLASGLCLVLGRADFHAQRAARAVLGCYLDGVGHALREFLELGRHALEGRGCAGQQLLVVDLLADDGVRADHDALAALDAQVGFPNRDFQGDVAFFPLRGAGREGAVHRHGAHGHVVAFEGQHRAEHVLDEVRRFGRDDGPARDLGGGLRRNLDLEQVLDGRIDGGKVLLHNGFAALAVGLLDGVLDLGDGLLARQDAADGEEGGLHDGVHAAAHAGLFGHIVAVDHVELELLLDDLLLDFHRQLVPDLIGPEQAVEQEDAAGLGIFEHLELLEEVELVAGHEVGLVGFDQVGGVDRLGAEAQVGGGDRAGLLRVVDEVALGEVIGLFADDLDRVLVGAHRAVGAEAEEHAAHGLFGFDREGRVYVEAGVRNVVVDAHGEVVLGLGLSSARPARP